MVNKTYIAVLTILIINITAASDKLSEQYNLQLKPASGTAACQLDWLKAIPDFSAARLTASKYHSYCQAKYERCIHYYGSRKAGPSMTQCGAWKDYCNAQGVWPGPPYLFTNKEGNNELQNFH